MIYAYGICEPGAAIPPPRRRGLGGATLRALTHGGLAAIYSRHRSLRARPGADQLMQYERVLESLMARGPVLPLRFGTQLEREEDLEAVLDERAEELARGLDRVRGHVELGVRVIADEKRAAASSGREFLLARVETHRRAARLARELHAPLAQTAAASTLREDPAPPAILAASYLVPADAVGTFRRRADELTADQDRVRVLVTGPWPPYSFTAPSDEA